MLASYGLNEQQEVKNKYLHCIIIAVKLPFKRFILNAKCVW